MKFERNVSLTDKYVQIVKTVYYKKFKIDLIEYDIRSIN